MRTVHAWTLDEPFVHLDDGVMQFEVLMPRETQVLGIRESSGGIQLYGICNLEAEEEKRYFLVTGHGHRERVGAMLPDEIGADRYLGTVSQPGGASYHVFEATLAAVEQEA